MDALRRDDIESARRATPAERLAQALETMALGFDMKWEQLARRFPNETPEQIEARFQAWLGADRDDE